MWLDQENADKMVKALDQFGFSSLGLQAEDFLEPDIVIQLGYPPNRIDILIGLEGMDFETCYGSRIEVELNGLLMNFIDLQNLKKSKRLAGRLQDLADLENLG